VKTARFWHAEGDKARCDLCPHRCLIAEGRTGLCGVRARRGGSLAAEGYGLVSSVNLDPIEKKPLYHFMPGEAILSIGGWGCNFACAFCQNWSISQRVENGGSRYAPEEIVAAAPARGSRGIAYTYNEPLVNAEFVLDCAVRAAEAGLANVLVTNGYVLPEPASELLPLTDALNIDVKSMDDAFYRRHCRGGLQPVLDFAVQAAGAGCHVEITNLVIPGLNDDAQGLEALARWVAEHLGRGAPLHFSAYRPMYKMRAPATPADALERAREIGRRWLDYVYIGNVVSAEGRDTLCPGCGAVLVSRRGYAGEMRGVRNGVCAACGRAADVITSLRRPRPSRSPSPAPGAAP